MDPEIRAEYSGHTSTRRPSYLDPQEMPEYDDWSDAITGWYRDWSEYFASFKPSAVEYIQRLRFPAPAAEVTAAELELCVRDRSYVPDLYKLFGVSRMASVDEIADEFWLRVSPLHRTLSSRSRGCCVVIDRQAND